MFPDPSLTGRLACVTSYICRYDPRFSYYIYVPRNYRGPEQPAAYNLAVLVHGSERSAEQYRNQFKDFANQHDAVILAPLFPAGLIEPGELENYNLLKFYDISFDQVLLHMVDEASQRFPIRSGRFFLHGFSSGGQFAHRFFYLHSERLAAVSIGAPGSATYLWPEEDWPLGLRGMKEIFGREPDSDKMRQVPIQIVVGALDQAPRPGPDQAPHRLERARRLYECFQEKQFEARLDVVPEAGHEGFKMLAEVKGFFSSRWPSV